MPAKGSRGGSKGVKSPARVHKQTSPAATRASRSRQLRSLSPQLEESLLVGHLVSMHQNRTKLPKGRSAPPEDGSSSPPSSPPATSSGSGASQQHQLSTNAFKPVNAAASQQQHNAYIASLVTEAVASGAYGNAHVPAAFPPGPEGPLDDSAPEDKGGFGSSSSYDDDSHDERHEPHARDDNDDDDDEQKGSSRKLTAGDVVRQVYGDRPKIESSQCVKLSQEPANREPVQRREDQNLNLERRSNVEALLCHVAGTTPPQQCKNCRKGHGPWTTCVVYDGLMCSSCSNCWFNASGARCTFHVPDNGNRMQSQQPQGPSQAGSGPGQNNTYMGAPQSQQQQPPPPQPVAASPLDVNHAHANDISQWRMAQSVQLAIARGMDGAVTSNHGQRLLARIEYAARELGMRIAEYDEHVRASEGLAPMPTTGPQRSQPHTPNGSEHPELDQNQQQ